MDRKKCEYCGEEIHINSRRCAFCGSILKAIPDEPSNEIPQEFSEVIKDEGEKPDQENGIGQGGDVQKSNGERPAEGSVTHSSKFESYRPSINPLSNGIKVFLTVISSIIPFIGPMIGIIASIVLMSNDLDMDRRSFGKALLAASLTVFIISSMFCVVLFIIGLNAYGNNY